MAIRRIEVDFYGLYTPEPTSIPVGTKVTLKGGAASVELTVYTPNIVEKRDFVDENSRYPTSHPVFYLTEDIKFREQTLSDYFKGRTIYYRWKSSQEEDQGYEGAEREILKHPLIGREVAVLFGDERPGIHEDLFAKGYRIEVSSVGRGLSRIITTNARLTRGVLLDGQRDNIYGQEELPEVVVGGVIPILPQGKHEVRISSKNLRFVIDDEDVSLFDQVRKEGLNSLSREDIDQLINRGYGEDILFWATDPRHIFTGKSANISSKSIPQAKLDAILSSAHEAEIDPTQPITMTTLGGKISVQPLLQESELDSEEEREVLGIPIIAQ